MGSNKNLQKGCKNKIIPNVNKCSKDNMLPINNLGFYHLAEKELNFQNSLNNSLQLPYPTQLFLIDFRNSLGEIGISDSSLTVKYGSNKGLLKNREFGEFFCLGSSFISNAMRGINHSNSYTIAEDDLIQIRNVLSTNYIDSAKFSLSLLDKYEIMNELYIRKHRNERWYYHNPILKGRFFKNINNCEKGYWLGFAGADIHASKRGDYQIVIRLAYKDICHLYTFCEVFGLNSKKVLEGFDYDGNHMCVLRFECKSMIEDLYGHGFTSSHSKNKSVPEPIKRAVRKAKSEKDNVSDVWQTSSGKIALAWLYGYYDGDGLKASTSISCGSKDMLEDIKDIFNIYRDISGSDGDYYLTVGAHLMNKMQSTYNKGLPRKRRIWDERNDRHIIFKRSLDKARLTINDIRELVKYFTQKELCDIFHCSVSFFQRYLSNNNIFVPRKKIHIPQGILLHYNSKFLEL
jgi:hypothetical protein